MTNANLQETAGTSSAVTQLQLSALQSRVQTMEAKSANAQESASTSNVVTQLLGALQDRVRTLEAKTTGDFIMDNPNLKGLMYDYGVLKAAVAELQGLMSRGYAAAASDGGGGQGGWQASAPTSGAGCNHCWHVDDHERRITAIEQRVNNPGGDPWWAGAQRAAAGHAAPPGRAPAGPSAVNNQPPGARAPHARHIPPNTGFPDLKDYTLNKLFDDKIALSQEYTYNGTTGGQQWRRKVRGYFLAKCPDLQPLLDWAESKEDQIITDEELKAKAAENFWMMELDVKRCSSVVWGFLGICLKDAAHSLYELAPELNGFEAWRVVVNDIYKSQNIRLAGLRRLVRNPRAIAKIEDVNIGITQFDNLMKEYKLAGGELPSDADLKNDLLDSLPQEIREGLLWRSVEDEDFNAFKNHVRTTANTVLYHRGKVASSLNNVAEPTDVEEETYEDAILAVNKRFSRNGGGAGPRKPPATGGGDQPPRALKCLNCGDEGHLTLKCPKPRVEAGQRPCFGCGKKGHIARNCPDRTGSGGRGGNSRAVRNVDEPEKDEQDYTFCVSCADEDGFTTVASRRGRAPISSTPSSLSSVFTTSAAPGRAAARRPMPMARTLGAFVPTAPPKRTSA